ncbi:MAG: PadR family transcriptional regulator [Candidatus Binatia bacterium]
MAAPNRTAYAILGFLTVKPMSGYDVKKAVEASIDNFWKESYGQIYPILKRLSEEGSIEKSESATGGKRPRHLYTITERGREKLKSWLREPTEPSPVRMELLLKLFFGSQVDHNTNRRQIEDYRERLRYLIDRRFFRSKSAAIIPTSPTGS